MRAYYKIGSDSVGVYLSFRAVSSQVFSAQVSLTAVFGMGTGGPSPLWTPTMKTSLPVNTMYYFIIFTLHCQAFGDPWESRTPVWGVRGPRLDHLTNGPRRLKKSRSSPFPPSGENSDLPISSPSNGVCSRVGSPSTRKRTPWYTFRDSNPGHPD